MWFCKSNCIPFTRGYFSLTEFNTLPGLARRPCLSCGGQRFDWHGDWNEDWNEVPSSVVEGVERQHPKRPQHHQRSECDVFCFNIAFLFILVGVSLWGFFVLTRCCTCVVVWFSEEEKTCLPKRLNIG